MNPILIRRTCRDYQLLWAAIAALLLAFVIVFMLAVNSMPINQGSDFLHYPLSQLIQLLSSLPSSTCHGLRVIWLSNPDDNFVLIHKTKRKHFVKTGKSNREYRSSCSCCQVGSAGSGR